MNELSRRVLLLVTLLTPSVALAATTDTSSTPPAKHHRRLDGVVRVVNGGMHVAGAVHGSSAPSTTTSSSTSGAPAAAPAQQSSANGATSGSSFGNGSGTGNGSSSTPAPGSRVPVPPTGSSGPGHAPGSTRGAPSTPTPNPVNGGSSGVSRNGGNGGSSSGSGVPTTTIGSTQQTLSMIEQALMTAAVIYQILHTDSARNPHIPLPTHGTRPATHGSTPSTSSGTRTSSSSTDGSDDSSDDSGDDSDSSDTTTASSSSSATHAPANPSAPSSTNAGAVASGKTPASSDSTNAASASTDAPSSGTPLKSSAPETADGSSCELSKTKLPSVLDGTNAYCPTCVKNALDKLGDGVAQAAALSGGALRERDTIEQIVKIEESGVASGDYGAISADGAKLEYGAYQFSRASGQLQGVLRTYIQMQGADAKSVGVLKSYLQTMESGAPLSSGDHVFTDALRQAAKDPMMKKAQDSYFEREYVIPAVADASNMGLRSPLAAAVLVDLKTNGGYASVVAAAKKAVPTIANADDEKKFIAALLDARDARYKSLAAKPGYGQYLNTWLSRDKDFRNILASGNTDLAGEVKLANGSFCGGNGDDARAFSMFMSKQSQGSGSGSGSSTPALASI